MSARIDVIRGDTLRLAGYVLKGRAMKNLSDDTLTLSVIDKDNDEEVVTKTTGSGINQDSVGNYAITVTADETADLTDSSYRFRVKLDDDETGDEVTVARGDFVMMDGE